MSAPHNRRGTLTAALLSLGVGASAVAAWLILDGRGDEAGVASLVATVALAGSSMSARGPFWTFMDTLAYRVFDAAVLASIAWVSRESSPGLAAAALLALAAGFLSSYFVARGRALGYSIWGSTTNRALRCLMASMALLGDDPAFWLWSLVALSTLTALVRASQAFKEERV